MDSKQKSPKFMNELELLQQIRSNELGILDAQRTANDLARANLYLRNELNARRRRRNNNLCAGFPIGQLVVISSK